MAAKNDIFAEIALQRTIYRDRNLVEPAPMELSQKQLDCCNNNPDAIFEPLKKLSTEAELYKELEKYRRWSAKFLRELAPELISKRESLVLDAFEWRVETAQDQKDFSLVLSGGGNWEKVTVPHYGEPLGKAVTYYRTTFEVTKAQLETGAAFVCFKGVDYKAHVFVNGSFLGSHEGFFAPFEFDFTKCANVGTNTLVVKVENDYVCMGSADSQGRNLDGDKIYAATGLGYDDPQRGWHHCPPGMGIYREVFLDFRSRVFISDVFVRPILAENRAELWLEVFNCDVKPKDIELEIAVYGQNFDETIFEGLRYKPVTVKECGLNDDFQIARAKANGDFQKPLPLSIGGGVNYLKVPFVMKDFRLWDNHCPWLYQLQVKMFKTGAEKSQTKPEPIDTAKQQFGMRSFSIDIEGDPKGMMFLNNKPVRLRGANTMGHEQQCVFKKDFDQLRDDILLAKICNMNFLRLTQRPVEQEVYDYCDKLGMMTQTDLPVFGVLRRNQYLECLKQVAEMEHLVRPHPCNIMVSYINEPTPNSDNRPHRHLSRLELEDFFESADKIVKHLNPERVTKHCDGDYDPPCEGLPDRHCYPCWYNGQGVDIGKLYKGFWQPTKKDWYYACGEFGSEGLECVDLMQKYYPKEWLPQTAKQEKNWSPDSIVGSQTGSFHYFFFDTQETLEDWVEVSQNHQAFSTSIMTEAFRRDSRMVSFAIHLFIDAFPSGWMKSIMDFQRRPKKAFFAYRDALAPLLPSLRTDRFKYFSDDQIEVEAWLCNDLSDAPEDLKFNYYIEFDRKIIAADSIPAELQVCCSTFQGSIKLAAPAVTERSKMTLRVGLIDASGKVVNDNAIELEVFPQVKADPMHKNDSNNICVLGNRGLAKELCCDLGFSGTEIAAAINNCQIIIIDDYEAYKVQKQKIDEAVKAGVRVVFLELEAGNYNIGESQVKVNQSSFNPLHFASRKTGHEMVQGFKWDDFKHWYDPKQDRIKAIVEATFEAKEYEPILTCGNSDGNGGWIKTLCVGQMQYGSGSFIVSQLALAGRVKTNPTSKIFALKLLNAL